MRKITRHVRIPKESLPKLNDLKRDVAKAQGRDISQSEILKRALNIPNIKEVLVDDARIKKTRRFKGI